MPETIDVYMVLLGDASKIKGLQLAEAIREQKPGLKMIAHCGDDSIKSQMKKADKSGAEIAIILAETELANQQVTIKYLRDKKEQMTVSLDKLSEFIGTLKTS
jgi:histidyl-tRNA synthetase